AHPVTCASGSPAVRRSTAARYAVIPSAAIGAPWSTSMAAAEPPSSPVQIRSASRRASPTPARLSRAAASAISVRPVTPSSAAILLLPARHPERFDQMVEIAVDHVGQVVDGDVDPVVGHPALREVVGADLG